MTRTGATKGITLRNTRAVVTTRWNGKKAYTPLTLRRIESYSIDTALDHDTDSWQLDIGDTKHELGELLERDNEVRVQLYSTSTEGTIYLAYGMADEISFDESGIMRISGRDISAVAVDSMTPAKHYRHVKAHAVVAQQAKELGIRNVDLAKSGQVKKTQYSDGSETYWEFWHRLYRKEKAWIWCGPAGTLFAGKLNYNDRRPNLYFGVPRADMPVGIRDLFIPVTQCEFRKNTQQRVGEVWVLAQKGDNGFIVKAKDPTMASWIKRPRKIIQDSESHSAKAALRTGWEEIFEGKVGAIELTISVPETKWVIRQNQIARVRIPPMGIDDNFFIVGVRRQASPEGFMQEVRLRELRYAISRRVPQDPKLETRKPGAKLGTGIGVDLGIRDDWDNYFIKAAKKFHGPWDFTLFLATLLAICEQETGFANINNDGAPGPNRTEWYPWNGQIAITRRDPENPAAGATTSATGKDQHGRTREQWKQCFQNESPDFAVGPMQLYTLDFKHWADDYFKPNNRDEFNGGRWHPEHNIMAAAQVLRAKCRAAGLDDGKDVNLWAGVSLYGHNAQLYRPGVPTPYARSVKNKVYNASNDGAPFLQIVQDALKAAREAAEAAKDGATSGYGEDLAVPFGIPQNAAQCMRTLKTLMIKPTFSLTKADIREGIVATAMFGHFNKEKIDYTQGSQRMKDFSPPPNIPAATDCSAYATWCYKSAGAPDPNGANYNGTGYTGAQSRHGRALSAVSQLKQGDLVFFRGTAGEPDHVGVYVGQNMMVDHGDDPGPFFRRITDDAPRVGMRTYL